MARRCAEIRRVCRSTPNAESQAAIAEADTAILFHILLSEMATREFQSDRISPPTEFPKTDPVGNRPTSEYPGKFPDPFLKFPSSDQALQVGSAENPYSVCHFGHCKHASIITRVAEYRELLAAQPPRTLSTAIFFTAQFCWPTAAVYSAQS